MDRVQVEALIRASGSTPIGVSTSGWVSAPCPLAPWRHTKHVDSRPSFAIKVGPQSVFNCFGCGAAGDVDYLVQLLSHYDRENHLDFRRLRELVESESSGSLSLQICDPGGVSKGDVSPWPEAYLDYLPRAYSVGLAREYLSGRGVSESTSDLLDIRWDIHRKTVCFPIRDFGGRLCGLRGRRVQREADMPPYHQYLWKGESNGLVWFGEGWVNFDRPVLMVESVFDLAAVIPHYSNVISPMSATFSKDKLRRVLDQCREVVTLFDSDQAGDSARAKVSRAGGSVLVKHLFPTGTAKDPGEMPALSISLLLAPWLPGVV